MSVQFRFVPTTGALSGTSMLGQIERGFNELGSEIDDSNTLAEESLQIAQQAHHTAQQASLTATEALTTAGQARDTANEAATLAQNATTNAESATARANSAYDLAANANTDATEARESAATALAAAQAAQETADQALPLADEAKSLAENVIGALDGLKTLVSSYRREDGPSDLNDLDAADKLFFSGEGVLMNAPEGQSSGYLEVFTILANDEESKILQIFTAAEGNPVFRREAEVTTVGDEEIVTWGEWTETDANKGRVTAHSPAGTRGETIPAGEAYEVPEYVVGRGALTVYLNGLICLAGDDPAIHQYREVGEVGEDGTAITFHDDMLPEYDILVTA